MGYTVYRETIPEATQEETTEWYQIDAPAGAYVASAFAADITPGDFPAFYHGNELFLDGSDRVTGMEFARNPSRDTYGYLVCVTGEASGNVTLTAGVGVVSHAALTSSSKIFLEHRTAGGTTAGNVYRVTSRTPGTGFTISALVLATLATGILDTSVVDWHIIEP